MTQRINLYEKNLFFKLVYKFELVFQNSSMIKIWWLFVIAVQLRFYTRFQSYQHGLTNRIFMHLWVNDAQNARRKSISYFLNHVPKNMQSTIHLRSIFPSSVFRYTYKINTRYILRSRIIETRGSFATCAQTSRKMWSTVNKQSRCGPPPVHTAERSS